MKPKDIGQSSLTAWRKTPVDFTRLFGRLYRTTPAGMDLPLRVLVKVGRGLESGQVERSLAEVWATAAERRESDRVASRIQVRPLGRQLKDGTRWYIIELPISLGAYLSEVHYDRNRMTELTAEIGSIEGVIQAELDLPSENLVRPLQEFIPGCTAGRAKAPDEVDWAPRLVGLFELPSSGATGSGVRIGQLDTGFTEHPELDLDTAYDRSSSTSTIDSGGGLDPMHGGTSHGTATGSVITSRYGTQATNDLGDASAGITGLATGGTMVAVRTLDSSPIAAEVPVLVPSAIALAVHHCIDAGAHVITMSIGGIVSAAVKDALHEAYEDDMILCAAAGNCVGIVVEPASFPEVIGCGGIGIDKDTGTVHLWPGTSQGPEVDISAPAENVWVADWIDGDARVRPGEGTSFATPHVSAAAALWLDHHGRQALLNLYQSQGMHLCDVFREVLKRSATVPLNWNTFMNGAGVLNLPALMAEALPDAGSIDVPLPDDGLLQLIPTVAEPVDVTVEMSELLVGDDGEFWGGAEPYLLQTYCMIDGDSATLEVVVNAADLSLTNPPFQAQLLKAPGSPSIVRIETRGSHGNLPEVNVGPLEMSGRHDVPIRFPIPYSTGLFTTKLKPIPVTIFIDLGTGSALSVGLEIDGLPGFVGVHGMLWEEDFTPEHVVETNHEQIAADLQGIVADALLNFDLSDISVDTTRFTERLAEKEDDARSTADSKMGFWEGLFGGWEDPDDLLIDEFLMVNVLALQNDSRSAPFSWAYAGGSQGKWTMNGEIRLGDR